jgi:DNA-binding NarL/FixJ family response regulator
VDLAIEKAVPREKVRELQLRAIRQFIEDSGCRAKVIFLTAHEDPDYIEAAWSVGALGYVVKSRIATDLLPAIREALQGRRFISSFQLA